MVLSSLPRSTDRSRGFIVPIVCFAIVALLSFKSNGPRLESPSVRCPQRSYIIANFSVAFPGLAYFITRERGLVKHIPRRQQRQRWQGPPLSRDAGRTGEVTASGSRKRGAVSRVASDPLCLHAGWRSSSRAGLSSRSGPVPFHGGLKRENYSADTMGSISPSPFQS